MATFAVGLAFVLSGNAEAPEDIYLVGYSLKMIRVYASAIAAQMI